MADKEQIVDLRTQVASLREDRAKLTKGLAALRKLLRAMRSHHLGGYMSYNGAGKWSFATTGMAQTTPEDLNVLFAFAGIEPDEIKPLGSCFRCQHAKIDGSRRGWDMPCAACNGARLNKFVPADRLTLLSRARYPLDKLRQRKREEILARLRDPKPTAA